MSTVGKLIENESECRDAIHVAIAPVVASGKMYAGQDIGFIGSDKLRVSTYAPSIGIVDPFLKDAVLPGQRFWMFLYPNTITSLRHDWTHPAFVVEDNPLSASTRWMQEYAASIPIRVEELLEVGRDYAERGKYLIQGGRFEGESLPDEFWDHYEVITGKTVAPDQRGSFHSCIC